MKRVLGIIFLVLLLIGIALWLIVRSIQGPEIEQGQTNLRFVEVPVDWSHESNLDIALPFMAAAIIDVDNDGIDEVFVGGGTDQADTLQAFNGENFQPLKSAKVFAEHAKIPSYGAASLDMDGNGYADLFVARETGLWLYMNTAGEFTEHQIPVDFAENTAPLSIALGDIDNDKDADLYISGYIKIAYVEGETIFNKAYGGYSYLLRNDGDLQFTDITKEAGVFRQHNTFTAAFLDLDNDRDSDLVIAQDTGVVEMYENTRDGKFVELPHAKAFSYPMGLGFGDYDNNGLIDLYFSNVGNTLPKLMVRGDLTDEQELNTDYILLRNDGALDFSDTAIQTDSAKHGFGWGVVMHDMNLDGLQDLLVAQNYARFPGVKYLELYKGRLLQQNDFGKFQPVEETSGAANPYFAMTPLVSDFNNDGWPDLVWANLTGPLRVLLSKGGKNAGLKVRLPNSAVSLGARVYVTLSDGTVLSDQFATSEGLGSDSNHDLVFGIGAERTALQVKVVFADGHARVIESPPVNSVLVVEPAQ